MRLVISGANGFIGRHLCRRLLTHKIKFSCLVRNTSEIDFFIRNKIDVIQPSNDEQYLINYFVSEGVDGVIHLASRFIAEHNYNDIDDLISSNIGLGTKLLEASVNSNVKFFINTGTFWQHYSFLEYDPVNLYAATKQAFEDIARYYANAHGLRFCTLKLCDTYGPDDTRTKVFNVWDKIAKSGESLNMSPGEQLIDIVHVDYVVDAYLKLLHALDSGIISDRNCESYCVGSDEQVSLKKLAQVYERKNNVKLNIIWGGREYRKREVMSPSCVGFPIKSLPAHPWA